jgi:hypothetical protein
VTIRVLLAHGAVAGVIKLTFANVNDPRKKKSPFVNKKTNLLRE